MVISIYNRFCFALLLLLLLFHRVRACVNVFLRLQTKTYFSSLCWAHLSPYIALYHSRSKSQLICFFYLVPSLLVVAVFFSSHVVIFTHRALQITLVVYILRYTYDFLPVVTAAAVVAVTFFSSSPLYFCSVVRWVCCVCCYFFFRFCFFFILFISRSMHLMCIENWTHFTRSYEKKTKTISILLK